MRTVELFEGKQVDINSKCQAIRYNIATGDIVTFKDIFECCESVARRGAKHFRVFDDSGNEKDIDTIMFLSRCYRNK